jgi:hypothetical protein
MKNVRYGFVVIGLLLSFFQVTGQAPVLAMGKASLGGVYTGVYIQRIAEIFQAHNLEKLAWEDTFFYGKNADFSVDIAISDCDDAPLATVVVATNRGKEEADQLLKRVVKYLLEGRVRD